VKLSRFRSIRRIIQRLHFSDWGYENMPPEASNLCPFTQRASSEHKNATTPPMSSGTPTRPKVQLKGDSPLIFCLSLGNYGMGLFVMAMIGLVLNSIKRGKMVFE
jgi:hypothetical protein